MHGQFAAENLENHGQSDPTVNDCIDLNQIRSWIQNCEQNHGPRCIQAEYQSPLGIPGARLIDICSFNIVDFPPGAQYFTLSYIWGGFPQLQLSSENATELSQPQALLAHWDNIPLTIKDAIEFVRRCSGRYLWIDSLCILQDDLAEKYSQIEQMAAIYNGAVATLIAGVGQNCNVALPGIRSGTRDPEKTVPKYHDVYVVEPGVEDRISFRRPIGNTPYHHLGRIVRPRQLDLLERIAASAYDTRAWTLQERLLSRRCLYFMENMVYFHCRHSICTENKYAPYLHSANQIRRLSLFTADPIFSGNPMEFQRTYGAIYARIVKEYTLKHLTFEMDILRAFVGIAAAMEKTCSWRFVAGLPEQILDYALLWVPDINTAGRREEAKNLFPTWSWAAYKGGVSYGYILREQQGFEPFMANGRSFVENWEIYESGSRRVIPSALPVRKQALARKRPPQFAIQKQVHELIELSKRQPRPILVFEALCVPFRPTVNLFTASRIKSEDNDRATWAVDMAVFHSAKDSLPRAISLNLFFFTNGRGNISVNPSSQYDIVLLSESKLIGFDFEEWIDYDDARQERDIVMLVEWKDGFAERVALGYTNTYTKLDELIRCESDGDYGWKRIVLV